MTHHWQPNQVRLSTLLVVATVGPPVVAAMFGVFGRILQFLALLLVGLPLLILLELTLGILVLIGSFRAIELVVKWLWDWKSRSSPPDPKPPQIPYNAR